MANEAKTLKEVREMNYWQATSYFVDGMHYTDDVAIKYMQEEVFHGVVYDVRGQEIDEKVMRDIGKGGYFVLVDGLSCTGKTSFAEMLKKRYDVEVMDIDYLSAEYARRVINYKFSRFPVSMRAYMKENFTKIFEMETDNYIHSVFEQDVKKAAKTGKTVVVVGMYLDIITRAVVADKLGKYCKSTVGFVFHEDWETIIRREKERDIKYGTKDVSKQAIERDKKPYEYMQKALNPENGWISAFACGYRYTFICNHGTKFLE